MFASKFNKVASKDEDFKRNEINIDHSTFIVMQPENIGPYAQCCVSIFGSSEEFVGKNP
jgi:hypothetical protein